MVLDSKYLVFGFPTGKKGPLLVGTGGAVLADGTTGTMLADSTTGPMLADGTTRGAILADGTTRGGPSLAGGTGGVTFKDNPATSMGELDSSSHGPPATAMFKLAPIGEGLCVGVDI